MNDPRVKKVFDVVVTELCRRVGLKYPPEQQVAPQDYEWPQSEEDDFRKWLTDYLKSVQPFKRMGVKYIKKEVDYFMFQYGWKVKDADDLH
jgi:hypothetical protein